MRDPLIVLTLAAAIASGTPLIFAGIGGVISERSGVLNLGMEGMMLIGAVSAFLINSVTSSATISFIAAGIAGAMLALIHAGLTISLRANQIVSGLALTIFGTGLANYLGTPIEGERLKKTFGDVSIPLLQEIPWLGPIFFEQDVLVYFSWVVAIAGSLYLNRTRTGLGMRAVGENPATADAMGIRVAATRYAHVAIGGVMAGFGGAYVVLRVVPSWSQAGTTAGLGWIALALVVFAGWRPLRVILGAYIFGIALQANFALQAADITIIPAEFLAMLPYLLTVGILVVLTASKRDRAGAPASLGLPFVRDER
jgi:general nucleoside transport system permease protein